MIQVKRRDKLLHGHDRQRVSFHIMFCKGVPLRLDRSLVYRFDKSHGINGGLPTSHHTCPLSLATPDQKSTDSTIINFHTQSTSDLCCPRRKIQVIYFLAGSSLGLASVVYSSKSRSTYRSWLRCPTSVASRAGFKWHGSLDCAAWYFEFDVELVLCVHTVPWGVLPALHRSGFGWV